MTRLTKRSIFEGKYTLKPSISDIFDATNKLGQLEDVLVEFDIESAKDLRNHLLFKENMAIWEGKFALENEIKELKSQLSKAIVPKFEIGDYFEIIWNGELDIYKYIGDNKFNCLTKPQGYLCDYVILGMLLTDNGGVEKISQAEAQAKLDEIRRNKDVL